jgi:hypothetical protein
MVQRRTLNLELPAYPEINFEMDGFKDFAVFAESGGFLQGANSTSNAINISLEQGGVIGLKRGVLTFKVKGLDLIDNFFVLYRGEVVASSEAIQGNSFELEIPIAD